jgi:putative transposase
VQNTEPLLFGHFYHIFNRGIDSCNLFKDSENYTYFLDIYDQYISPVADTFAWALMPNHFHFLIRIKDVSDLTGFQNLSGLRPPHQYFSNLFNAYTKSINKRFLRHGALFEHPFKRKAVEDREYLKQVLLYIHNNPVHHGFCNHPVDYPWISYLTFISLKPTKLQRDSVISWFDDAASFKHLHNQKIDIEEIEHWLHIK